VNLLVSALQMQGIQGKATNKLTLFEFYVTRINWNGLGQELRSNSNCEVKQDTNIKFMETIIFNSNWALLHKHSLNELKDMYSLSLSKLEYLSR
jgi:hypothetical protein